MRGLLFIALNAMSAVAFAGDWTHAPALSLDKAAFSHGTFGPAKPAQYISLELPFEPFAKARKEVEKRSGLALSNRGEAHITVVTPPEFEQLVKVMAPAEIRRIVGDQLKSAKSEIKAICVGQGVRETTQAWFVVVEMPAGLQARENLEKEFVARLKLKARQKAPQEVLPQFHAKEFYPHVTLGFIGRDLHLQDGVVKNETSCKYPIY